jgi:hypothetical protein
MSIMQMLNPLKVPKEDNTIKAPISNSQGDNNSIDKRDWRFCKSKYEQHCFLNVRDYHSCPQFWDVL